MIYCFYWMWKVLGQMKIRDYGIKIGTMPTGERNAITDVGDVAVGHVTLALPLKLLKKQY
jgi:D-aminopeptidase